MPKKTHSAKVQLLQFKATDAGYREACEFVGRTLDYNDEEGRVTLSPEAIDPPVVAAEGDCLLRWQEPDRDSPTLFVCKPVTVEG